MRMKIFKAIAKVNRKPRLVYPVKFGLPKNVNHGKPKFSVYRSVYRLVYGKISVKQLITLR